MHKSEGRHLFVAHEVFSSILLLWKFAFNGAGLPYPMTYRVLILTNEFPFCLTYLNIPRLGLQTVESGCERHSNFLEKDIKIWSLHDMEAFP